MPFRRQPHHHLRWVAAFARPSRSIRLSDSLSLGSDAADLSAALVAGPLAAFNGDARVLRGHMSHKNGASAATTSA